MLTLLFLFAMKVAIPSEMACVGSIQDATVPLDVYIAAVEMEGTATFAVEGQVLYLNGPKVSSLKPGSIQRVVRPEGVVRDPLTGYSVGNYYMDIGTIIVAHVEQEQATARVQSSCQGMLKGDVVIPHTEKASVDFDGALSDDLTVLPGNGIASSIILGKDDLKELGAGNFCFVGLGERDGVKAGDRLTVFRSYPKFNARDMATSGTGTQTSYSPINTWAYRFKLEGLLRTRSVPPQILGDIVVVETWGKISAGKVVNSLSEIHIGDLVVKR